MSWGGIPDILAGAYDAAKKKKPHVFHDEGPDLYAAALNRNQQFATHEAPWQTELPPKEEGHFLDWLKGHDDPGGFDPNAKAQDYDMRGFYDAMHGTPATEDREPAEHFTDQFKTPFDTTFSAESQYAEPDTPFVWVGDKLINKRTGAVMFEP